MRKTELTKEQQEKFKWLIEEPKTMKIPFLNLEVAEIQDWDKPYNEIQVPKGWRLIKGWEFWAIIESEYCDEFLGKYKGGYNWFWTFQTRYAIENNYSSRLCLGRVLDVYSDNPNLAYSHDNGRVVFVRDLEAKNDKRML